MVLLAAAYTSVQSIMGLAIDCQRSTVYISEYDGLRATALDGAQKWLKPLRGGWGLSLDSSTGNV